MKSRAHGVPIDEKELKISCYNPFEEILDCISNVCVWGGGTWNAEVRSIFLNFCYTEIYIMFRLSDYVSEI